VDPKVREVQLSRLNDLRARRDGEQVKQLLGRLEQEARGSDNLMPHLVACAEGLCTLGEMCDVLRSVFGTYQEMVVV
jgi:methylmalonyl-CoA mutase N-terminal domain/subunit